MGPRCQVIRMGPGCGRPPPKEAQNTAPVQQNLAARGPNFHTNLTKFMNSDGGQTAVSSQPVDVGDADVGDGGGYDNDSDVF